MTKEVLVTITGLQSFAGAGEETPQPVELVVAGEYYYKNGRHYILYDEVMEGFDGVTKNMLKLGADSLEITKRGCASTRMVFEKDKKMAANYETPFGSMCMDIDAKDICVTESDRILHAQVHYALAVDGAHLADCALTLHVQPRE